MLFNNVGLLARKYAARFHDRALMTRQQRGAIISFTFDDFPLSAFDIGGGLLAEYGLKATYYAAMGLMGQKTVVGNLFSANALRSLVNSGHELGCHTYDHVRCCDVSVHTFLGQCEKNRLAVSSICGGYACRQFSFPEGVVTSSAKSALEGVYDTCRTVEPGINGTRVDFRFLRANPVYSTISLQKIEQIIHENQRRQGWIVLYTHDISSEPSTYGCTPEYFRKVLHCAVESGAAILTVGEASKRFRRVA